MRQIKIQHWIILFFLPLLTWSGCHVEEIGRGDGTTLPEGVTRLVATVRQGVRTRAVGDPLNDATYDEKRVDRLAFFVHTEAEGMQVYEPAKSSETYDDFPNKVRLEAVDPADPAKGYTATVDLTAGAGYDADIIAVANLPEDYDYSQIVSWQGVLDSVTVGTFTTSMPLCTGNDGAGHNFAFVMYGSTTVALHKEKEEAFSLSLERLTARIDITNEAYVAGMETDDTKNGFLLTSVRILHARPQSYIVPQMDYIAPDVLTVNDWMAPADSIRLYKVESPDKAKDVTNGTSAEKAGATCQRVWHSLYTYENHETEHAPTSLEIKGKFRGKEITRQIPFVVTDADGITKKPVPIVRNHRYLVRISPAQGETDITYKITVGEWNAVDTVNVQPNQDQMPILSDYASDQATRTYDGDGTGIPDSIVVPATGGTITFTASCPFDTRVTFDYASDEDKGSGAGWLSVVAGEPVYTKAEASVSRKFTVTVTNDNALEEGYVKRGYMYIANGGNGSIVDTIMIYQGPDIAYAGTRFTAVTLGEANSKAIVWAPINLGATELTKGLTKLPSSTSDPEYEKVIEANAPQCGSYFQWGRKTAFKYKTYKGEEATNTPFETPEKANESSLYYDSNFTTTFWLKDGGNIDLWNGPKTVGDFISSEDQVISDVIKTTNDPCPKGWRVPTLTEFKALLATGITSDVNDTDSYTSFSKDGVKLLFPHGGGLCPEAAFLSSRGYYWSSTMSRVVTSWGFTMIGENNKVTLDSMTSKTLQSCQVRCVKE